MNESGSHTVSVARRLTRLERANRRLRAVVAALVLVMGAAVLGGAMWVQEVQKAAKFVLSGGGDGGGGEFSLSKAGMPQLLLKDRDGIVRAAVGLDATGRPALALNDKFAKPRARLEVGAGGEPALALLNAAGKRVKVFATGAPKPSAGKKKNVRVKFSTSLGDFIVELDAEKAPVSVDNFLQYVDDKYYDGTIFHRVISNFMIQGGGFTTDEPPSPKDTHAPIINEGKNGLKNARGTIAMARTGMPDSATSQFFINVVDNGNLDYPKPDGHGYAVFGKVVDGMEIVDKIKNVKTESRDGAYAAAPTTVVEIKSVRRVEGK